MGRPPASRTVLCRREDPTPGPGDPGDPAGKMPIFRPTHDPGKKIYTEDLGSHWITYLELPTGEKLQVSSPAPMPEDAQGIAFAWQDACFFDGTKEELL